MEELIGPSREGRERQSSSRQMTWWPAYPVKQLRMGRLLPFLLVGGKQPSLPVTIPVQANQCPVISVFEPDAVFTAKLS